MAPSGNLFWIGAMREGDVYLSNYGSSLLSVSHVTIVLYRICSMLTFKVVLQGGMLWSIPRHKQSLVNRSEARGWCISAQTSLFYGRQLCKVQAWKCFVSLATFLSSQNYIIFGQTSFSCWLLWLFPLALRNTCLGNIILTSFYIFLILFLAFAVFCILFKLPDFWLLCFVFCISFLALAVFCILFE